MTLPQTDVQSLRLHDFHSSRELSAQIKRFFTAPARRNSLLLLQCDTKVVSKQKILQARSLCEQWAGEADAAQPTDGAAAAAAAAPTVQRTARHVVLLVHASRSSGGGYLPFSVDFDATWTLCFVDDLCTAASSRRQPDTTALVCSSPAQLLEQLNLIGTMRDRYLSCLSRLHGDESGVSSTTDIRNEILSTSQMLHSEQVVRVIAAQLSTSLLEDFEKFAPAAVAASIARDVRSLQQHSTFRAALYAHYVALVEESFTAFLTFVNRNGNAALFAERDSAVAENARVTS